MPILQEPTFVQSEFPETDVSVHEAFEEMVKINRQKISPKIEMQDFIRDSTSVIPEDFEGIVRLDTVEQDFLYQEKGGK